MIAHFAEELEKLSGVRAWVRAGVRGARGRRSAPGAAARVAKVRGEPGSAVMSPGSGKAILGSKWSLKKIKSLRKRAPKWG